MSVQLTMPVERSLLSADPVHQINDFRSFLNVLGDPQVKTGLHFLPVVSSWKCLEAIASNKLCCRAGWFLCGSDSRYSHVSHLLLKKKIVFMVSQNFHAFLKI
jgi:hypothetical protein